MVLSETLVSAWLEASITGAGLVLAIYALVTPIFKRIFKNRAKRRTVLFEEFENKRKIVKPDSDKDFERMTRLRKEIRQIGAFPKYLSIGTAIAFLSFIVSIFSDSYWLLNPNSNPQSELILFFIFSLGILSFAIVGILTTSEILLMMKDEFEDIKKKEEEEEQEIEELAKKYRQVTPR